VATTKVAAIDSDREYFATKVMNGDINRYAS
jgi:hypothetical protein